MMTENKTKADSLVAAETILIEGKAFERGVKVTGVSKDELARAVTVRRVVRQSEFEAQGVPAPEIGGDEPEADGAADDTDDNGDTAQ
jgi:hypothetical protein